MVAPSWAVPSYPSAAEVAAAKKNVSAKKAMIARIEKIVQELAVEANKLGRVAQIKGEAFNQAQDAVDAITAKVNSLQAQADAANAEADKAKAQLGQIAALWGLRNLADWVAGERLEILARRHAMEAGLRALEGWETLGCGAYFAYVRHPSRLPSPEFARQLVQDLAQVLARM